MNACSPPCWPGLHPGDVLGAGMEGTVVDLGDALVAKVWHGRSREDLTALLTFGLGLGAAPIPFATAGAVELLDLDGRLVTIERKVRGVRLSPGPRPAAEPAGAREARIIGDVLDGLKLATDPRLGVLPALPGEPPLETGATFGQALARLAERRFEASADSLRVCVRDIDRVMARLTGALSALPDGPTRSLIHGDLIPGNILVSDDTVSGVLDFGFLTMLGDPQFDAAIAASIYDMYGTNARQSEDRLSGYFVDRFSHDEHTYALYRGAYAVITHAVFGRDLSEGHFAWCVDMLHRADIRAALSV
ncbi:phosphotransferase [Tessaracoccus sp. HDW20]|uniref:phosphotransferase family protein n=1 Tax=Tessaracoccus coleopterorum TaxID=2714950 RepID=UPI0018D4033A|nr:phosphotransferase [Tessaracoccus coleopterorum]NHB83644.1 phosphotransferase [Tessaracoccus coleopterorum]